MRRILIAFTLAVVWLHQISNSLGNSASPFPVVVSQPDGQQLVLFLRGNEKLNWFEYVPEAVNLRRDLQLQPKDAVAAATPGYTVVQNADGQYVFAVRDANGNWAPSDRVVGRNDPVGQRRIMPTRENIIRGVLQRLPQPNIPSRSAAPVGVVKNLVVLMRFSDHAQRQLPPKAQFEQIFNSPVPVPGIAPTGSVNSFYKENSYGKMDLQSTVIDWITLPHTEAYYANGQSGLSAKIREAMTDALNILAASGSVNFADFDNENGGSGDGWIDAITFVHSGYAAEFGGVAGGAAKEDRIWSHRWVINTWSDPTSGVKVSDYNINPGIWGTSGNSIGHIGVICHELGHFFGLPDLYDYSGTGEGAGSWCLMANSWGFDGTQQHPPHMSAWCKLALSWNNATVINGPGTYQLAATTSPNAKIYRINYPSGSPAEYLLIEDRQAEGEFDGGIPAGTGGRGGLAIWHIDDLVPENDHPGFPGSTGFPGDHYKVGLLQADGRWDLEKGINRGDADDVFRAGHVDSITSSTTPDSTSFTGVTLDIISQISASGPVMSFKYGTDGVIDPVGSATFAGNVNVPAPTSHVANFSQDGKAATILLDRLESSVYGNDAAETTSATFILPLKQAAPGSTATIHIRGYLNVDVNSQASIVATVGGKTELINPAEHPDASPPKADGGRREFATKMQRGMNPKPAETAGSSFLYTLNCPLTESDRLAINLVLVTSKQKSSQGAYVVVDSINFEIKP